MVWTGKIQKEQLFIHLAAVFFPDDVLLSRFSSFSPQTHTLKKKKPTKNQPTHRFAPSTSTFTSSLDPWHVASLAAAQRSRDVGICIGYWVEKTTWRWDSLSPSQVSRCLELTLLKWIVFFIRALGSGTVERMYKPPDSMFHMYIIFSLHMPHIQHPPGCFPETARIFSRQV